MTSGESRAKQGILYPYKGQMLSRNAIAKAEGVSKQAIAQRLQKYGRIPDTDELCALNDAQRRNSFGKYQNKTGATVVPNKYEYHGESLSIGEIASREGLCPGAIYQRLRIYGAVEKRAHVVHCSKCKKPGHNQQTCKEV
jgi:predicted DNA-binding protein YlxM (UPF0122 family)